MKYNQPFDQPTNPNAPYVNGNPATGTPGSIPQAAAIEYPQREIVNLITNTGFTPDNADLNQLQKGIRSGKLNFLNVSGTNTLTASMPGVALDAYSAGLRVWFIAPNSNTASPVTISINGLGAKNIVRPPSTALSIGDIQAATIVVLVYDGTNFQYENFGGSVNTIQNVIYNTQTPYFVLTQSGTSSISTGVDQFVPLTVDSGHFFLDAASNLNSSRSNGFFCGAKDAGMWLFIAVIGLSMTTTGQINVAAAVNGVLSPYQAISIGTTVDSHMTYASRMSASDYCNVNIRQNSGVSQTASQCMLIGVRLSA